MFLWLAIERMDDMLTRTSLVLIAAGIAVFGIAVFCFWEDVVIRETQQERLDVAMEQ